MSRQSLPAGGNPEDQPLAGRAAGAIGDAMLAGLVVGIVETVRLAKAGAIPSTAVIAVGLSLIVAIAAGVPLGATFALVSGRPWFKRWTRRLGEGGGPRNRAVGHLALILVAAVGLFAVTYVITTRTFGRFNAAGALGLLNGTAILVATLAIIIALAWLDERLGPRLESSALMTRGLTGKLGLAVLVITGGGALVGIAAFARTAAPDADFRPLLLALVFVAALITARVGGPWRRLPRAALVVTLAVGAVLPVLALSQLGHRDVARAQIAAHGVPSGVVLRALWRLSDGDDDGFAGAFGGGDCDDSNPAIHPDADEIVENGVDDNCAGGDLLLSALEHRTRPVPSQTANAPRKNVILISVDAMRADHTSAYGFRRPTTPHLERLAARSARFDWAITPSPSTRRAIPAMLGARYASTMAFIEGGEKKVWPPRLAPKHHPMLGETFKAAGYQTAAVLCCTTLFDRRMGVTVGIDHVDASAARLKRKYHGDHLLARFKAYLTDVRKPERPFFVWIHFLDAHSPYKQLPGAPTYGKKGIDRYDSELWYVDDKIGAMLAELETAGLAGDTIVAVTSDHGEEFYEHGNRFHGRSLYNELIRVPLVVHVPGLEPTVLADPVSIIDVGPTLLDLVGLSRPAGQNGRSLASAVRGEPLAPRMVLSELIADRNIHRNLRAGLRGEWKVIWDLDANTYELYSLASDPADKRDVASDKPTVLRTLIDELHHATDLELSLLPTDKHYKRALNMRQRAQRDWGGEKSDKGAAKGTKGGAKVQKK